MKHVLIFFVIVSLIGCAQAPKTATTFDQSKIAAPDDKAAVIILYRKMVPPVIYSVSSTINGKPFAKLPNNSFSWVKVIPGEYKISIGWPVLAVTPGETKNLTVEAGKYYFVEFGGSTSVGYSGAGPVGFNTQSLQVLEPSVGIKIVKDCCKYIPSQF